MITQIDQVDGPGVCGPKSAITMAWHGKVCTCMCIVEAFSMAHVLSCVHLCWLKGVCTMCRMWGRGGSSRGPCMIWWIGGYCGG